jgi:arylsulfatase A-like enzyme
VLAQSTCQAYNPIVDLWDGAGPSHLNGTQYEEFIFRDRVYSTVANHNVSEPLFLLYTPHTVHCPLQVPKDQLDKFAFVTDDETACQAQTAYIYPGSGPSDYRCRAQYLAMVNLLDGVLGNITDTLKAKGMWDETLMILTSDNGGPSGPTESGSNNYPLRGGKYSFFEGGIRATAFVSGGFVPAALRGTQQSGLVHIADWYATLCDLAGVDPTDYVAAAGKLPPIDSLNVWPLISGQNSTSPRTEIPVSESALIQGQYKLLTGPQIEATWSGPSYPNASSPASPVDPGPTLKCAGGCLFDVIADPTEHNDIAAQNPALVASMSARLAELVKGYYTNNDTFVNLCPSNITMPCACWAALNTWGGYFGPYSV